MRLHRNNNIARLQKQYQFCFSTSKSNENPFINKQLQWLEAKENHRVESLPAARLVLMAPKNSRATPARLVFRSVTCHRGRDVCNPCWWCPGGFSISETILDTALFDPTKSRQDEGLITRHYSAAFDSASSISSTSVFEMRVANDFGDGEVHLTRLQQQLICARPHAISSSKGWALFLSLINLCILA
jgi:hypothetical protein